MHIKKYLLFHKIKLLIIVNFLLFFIFFSYYLYSENVYGYSIGDWDIGGGGLHWQTIGYELIINGNCGGGAFRPMDELIERPPWYEFRYTIRKVTFDLDLSNYSSAYSVNNGASMNGWFEDFVNLVEVDDIPYGVTDLSYAFKGCRNLEKVGNIPDTVVLMRSTFEDCISLEEPPVLPKNLSDYSVLLYKGTYMTSNQHCLYNTFKNCTSLKRTPEFPSKYDVRYLEGTFIDCVWLETISKIPYNIMFFEDTFYRCYNVKGIINIENDNCEFLGQPFYNIGRNHHYFLFLIIFDKKISDIIMRDTYNSKKCLVFDEEIQVYLDGEQGNFRDSYDIFTFYGVKMNGLIDNTILSDVGEDALRYYRLPLKDIKLPEPEIEGMVFEGWYYDKEFKHRVSLDDPVSYEYYDPFYKRVFLYANWVDPVGASIEYEDSINDWHNNIYNTDIKIHDNVGICKILVYADSDEANIIKEEDYLFPKDVVFNISFGDPVGKSDEGITSYTIKVTDYNENITTDTFTIKMDYTKPYLNLATDNDIHITSQSNINILGFDDLSGVKQITIKPSVSDVIDNHIIINEMPFSYVYPLEAYNNILGHIIMIEDMAGNINTIKLINRRVLNKNIYRIIPKENYL